MIKIPLTQGQYAIIDDDDFDFISKSKWRFKLGYALDGKGKTMHRQIICVPCGMFIDHINGNGLDNRKANLRICSHKENMMNKKIYKNNTSGYKGVTRLTNGKWRCVIWKDGNKINLGVFLTPEDAAIAYDKSAIVLYGEFAKTNF